MDDDVTIVWTTQGIAAVGTYSPAFAAQAWREHVDATYPASDHADHHLDELDWLSGVRRWIAQGPRYATAYPRQAAAPAGARPGLLLIGTFRGHTRHP